jgi:tetratricopeptide (TPR) repeat protein
LDRRQTISGELTIINKKLRLVLRTKRGVIFANTSPDDPDQPDALLDDAAIAVLDATAPAQGAVVHNNSGNTRDRDGKPEEAISEYRIAIKLDPNAAPPHNGLGNALSDQGKLDEAIAEYRTAARLDPKSPELRYNLGIILRQRAVAQKPEAARTALLIEACEQFVAGKASAPGDPDYAVAMRSIDALLPRGQHCPPRPTAITGPPPR